MRDRSTASRSDHGGVGLSPALKEANQLLAAAGLEGHGPRWLSGEHVEVLVGPVGAGREGGEEALMITVAPRSVVGDGVAGTVVELVDASGRIRRRLDSSGQACLPRPRGAYRLSLSTSPERHRAIPGGPARPPLHSLRRQRLVRLVPPVAAATAALLLLAGVVLLRPGSAVASVNVYPADCRNTAGTSTPGHVVVAGVWAQTERKRFTEVLERFHEATGIDVTFLTNTDGPDRDIAATLDDFLGKDCPPDVALLPQPALLERLAGDGELSPVDEATEQLIEQNYGEVWREWATVGDSYYGVWFKAANKSTVWYDVRAFARARVSPPDSWDGLKDAAAQLRSSGITPFSVGGADGWTLTDWFENVYLRMFPDDYLSLSEHRILWNDQSVKDALTKLAEIFDQPGWLAPRPLQTTYEESVRQVFDRSRQKAAMVFEGGFVANEIDTTGATLGKDAKYFDFPPIDGSRPPVVGTSGPANDGEAVGGDVAVLMNDTPAANRLLQFLATPEAAEPWVRAGGFASPNKKVDLAAYPDDATREAARTLVSATDMKFDLSDMQCPAFGADPENGMWPILQDFLREPKTVAETAQRLEQAWLPPPGQQASGRALCPSR